MRSLVEAYRARTGKKTVGQIIGNMRHGPKGIIKTLKTEESFRVEAAAMVPIIIAMLARGCSADNWWKVMASCTLVMSTELANSSRENDMRARYPSELELAATDPERHALVKAAFDQSAGSVTLPLLLALGTFIRAMAAPD